MSMLMVCQQQNKQFVIKSRNLYTPNHPPPNKKKWPLWRWLTPLIVPTCGKTTDHLWRSSSERTCCPVIHHWFPQANPSKRHDYPPGNSRPSGPASSWPWKPKMGLVHTKNGHIWFMVSIYIYIETINHIWPFFVWTNPILGFQGQLEAGPDGREFPGG